jgi:hypothetical protein
VIRRRRGPGDVAALGLDDLHDVVTDLRDTSLNQLDPQLLKNYGAAYQPIDVWPASVRKPEGPLRTIEFGTSCGKIWLCGRDTA